MSSMRFEAPTLLDYFATLVADDQQFSLLEAAISVAQDDDPALDVQGVLSQIDSLAAKLKQRIAADAGAMHRLQCLNRYFFQELGFAGNVNDYYDPRNSHLQHVLATRRGIPITLALLFIEIAQQIGLDARPVSFPGHFLIKLKMPQGEVIIDPFTGQSLSREALDERLAPYRRRQGLVGEFEAPLGLFLQAASARDVLARLLRNLQEVHRSAEDWPRLLAVQQRLVVLLPQAWEERRDLGLVWAEVGDRDAAAAELQAYLEQRTGADDAGAIGERLADLRRAAGTPRLH
jgi:regulator of sirC expression with transglutaminase-like and TPR domain